MKYYRVLALFALMLSALLSACGGGGGFSFSPKASPDSAKANRVSFLPAPEGQGLKQEVRYTYNYSSFQAKDGLTAVPMRSETEPDLSAADKCRVSTAPAGAKAITATVACERLDKPLAQVHYNPIK